jgi:hypothetical protein
MIVSFEEDCLVRRPAAIVIALSLIVAAGCAASSSTAGIVDDVVCGHDIGQDPQGFISYNAVGDATHKIVNGSSFGTGSRIYIRVAPGCDHGAAISWEPAGAARLIAEAKAHDGLPVVVVLAAARRCSPFTLVGTRDGQTVARASVVDEAMIGRVYGSCAHPRTAGPQPVARNRASPSTTGTM